MIDTRTTPAPDDDTDLTTNCRLQHQQWTHALTQHEQEISQLVALLTDLLAQHNSSTLRHRAIQYVSKFNNLKSRFQRLQLDMGCSGADCSPTAQPICPEPRFLFYTGLDLSIRRVCDEFTNLSTSCYQFLAVLVSLNLL